MLALSLSLPPPTQPYQVACLGCLYLPFPCFLSAGAHGPPAPQTFKVRWRRGQIILCLQWQGMLTGTHWELSPWSSHLLRHSSLFCRWQLVLFRQHLLLRLRTWLSPAIWLLGGHRTQKDQPSTSQLVDRRTEIIYLWKRRGLSSFATWRVRPSLGEPSIRTLGIPSLSSYSQSRSCSSSRSRSDRLLDPTLLTWRLSLKMRMLGMFFIHLLKRPSSF